MSAPQAIKTASARAMLLGPALVFMAMVFFLPIWTVLVQSVSDAAISNALPATVAAVAEWDPHTAPTIAMQEALAEDLRAIDDPQILGDVVRRLNSQQAGFRTLISRTSGALDRLADDASIDLVAIDPRWEDPIYWQAIAATMSPTTDRFLLAAVDMARDAAGNIGTVGPDVSANRDTFLRTFAIAATVTLVCLLIGYPYAMLMASSRGWVRGVLIASVLLPLWTSLLVRTAAWYVLLQDKGLINSALQWVGLIDEPLGLLFSRTGVVIAMSHVLLPFMVLPIYSVLLTIPPNLGPAAASLGANPIRSFLHVQLPLSSLGIASGALLVFMSAIGYYITPALIGGPTDQMISSLIAFFAMGSANWGMAAAFGVLLLIPTLLLYVAYDRVTSRTNGRST